MTFECLGISPISIDSPSSRSTLFNCDETCRAQEVLLKQLEDFKAGWWTITLPEPNSLAHENRPSKKEIFQACIFRCHVSFMEGRYLYPQNSGYGLVPRSTEYRSLFHELFMSWKMKTQEGSAVGIWLLHEVPCYVIRNKVDQDTETWMMYIPQNPQSLA